MHCVVFTVLWHCFQRCSSLPLFARNTVRLQVPPRRKCYKTDFMIFPRYKCTFYFLQKSIITKSIALWFCMVDVRFCFLLFTIEMYILYIFDCMILKLMAKLIIDAQWVKTWSRWAQLIHHWLDFVHVSHLFLQVCNTFSVLSVSFCNVF